MQEGEPSPQLGPPRSLAFTAALVCGLLLALAVHILLSARGMGLASVLRELFPSSTDQLRSALAWWAIGIAGCLGSWGTIVFLQKASARGSGQRLLRLGLGVVFVAVLVAAGSQTASVPTGGAAGTALVNLAAMALGAFMAFFAAHFAARR